MTEDASLAGQPVVAATVVAATAGVARAFWTVVPGRGELRAEPLGPAEPGEVLVKTLYSSLSRGTESLVFHGRVPETEWQRMRCPHQDGEFPFPVKYGYSAIGRVETGPVDLVGRTVFCLYPHQDRFVVAADAVVALPDSLPPKRAVLAANMETALNALWDSGAGPGDRVTVVGGGVVGCLIAALAGRLPGLDVTLVDVNPARAAIAAALSVGFATPDRAPADCDVVFHASGRAAGLSTALGLAGQEATVVEMSWYGTTEVAVPLGLGFHSRRLKLISSQVGQVSPSRRPRWTYARRLDMAIRLLADPRLDCLLAAPIRFDDMPARLPTILGAGSDVLCQLIQYDPTP